MASASRGWFDLRRSPSRVCAWGGAPARDARARAFVRLLASRVSPGLAPRKAKAPDANSRPSRLGFAYRHPDRYPVPVSTDTGTLWPVFSTRYRHPVLDDGYRIKGGTGYGTGCFQYRSGNGWRYWMMVSGDTSTGWRYSPDTMFHGLNRWIWCTHRDQRSRSRVDSRIVAFVWWSSDDRPAAGSAEPRKNAGSASERRCRD